jgi:PAS domain S-box-containing protein
MKDFFMEKDVQHFKPVAIMNENQPTVLVVEDDVGLNHLIRKTLERGGIKSHQALNGAEAIAAATILHYSLILLDYCLPDMTGKQIILALSKKEIHAVIIVMTGNGDERIAVEVMKMGVRDYIIKEPDFISKLPRNIHRVIEVIAREKELSHVTVELLKSEMRYRRLFESAKDGILILDADTGHVVDVNPFLTELLGYSHADILDKSIWELGEFRDIVSSHESFKELQDKEYIRYDDLPLKTRGGRVINVEFVSIVYMVDHSKVIQCNIRDITERKKDEEKIQHQLDELQRWQNMMLDREDRVQEIKGEVNDLCKRLGEPVRYPSQTLGSEVKP